MVLRWRDLRQWFCLAALLALILAPQLARADAEGFPAWEMLADRLDDGTAHALIIGVSQFDAPAWRPLGGVAREVAEVSVALADHGFEVQVARDDGRMTVDEMRAEVRRFVAAYGTAPENRLVIYFATHGHKDEGGDEGGYGLLVGSDTKGPKVPGFADSAYSVSELSQDLEGMRARHLYLFINACFSGAMLPAMGPQTRAAGEVAEIEGPRAEWALRLLDGVAQVVLTAGSDDQEVPDRDNPFAAAVVSGLAGAADLDGDGLILGSEVAQHVRSAVAMATMAKGRPNDPVFAILPRTDRVETAGMVGDFVFLSPEGPAQVVDRSEDAVLAARAARLPQGQFTECADCPVMVAMPPPGKGAARLAMARTEVTFAEWDACYREFGCRRFLPDGGLGRGDRPAGGVGWHDALEFAAWVSGKGGARCTGYRLPTLQEWQAAAGPADPGRAVCADCGAAGGMSADAAVRAGAMQGNDLGLQDMAGSLWEWVAERDAGCGLDALRETPRCEGDGMVVGGAFSTRADALHRAAEGGAFPRTSHALPGALPTLGLRLVCDLAGGG